MCQGKVIPKDVVYLKYRCNVSRSSDQMCLHLQNISAGVKSNVTWNNTLLCTTCIMNVMLEAYK